MEKREKEKGRNERTRRNGTQMELIERMETDLFATLRIGSRQGAKTQRDGCFGE